MDKWVIVYPTHLWPNPSNCHPYAWVRLGWVEGFFNPNQDGWAEKTLNPIQPIIGA